MNGGVTRQKAQNSSATNFISVLGGPSHLIVTNLVSALFVDGFWTPRIGDPLPNRGETAAKMVHPGLPPWGNPPCLCTAGCLPSYHWAWGMGRHLPPCRDLTKGFFTQGSRSESVGMLMLELKNRAGKNTEHVQNMYRPKALCLGPPLQACAALDWFFQNPL